MAFVFRAITGLFYGNAPPNLAPVNHLAPPARFGDLPEWIAGPLTMIWRGILDTALRMNFATTFKILTTILDHDNQVLREDAIEATATRYIKRCKFNMALATALTSASFIVHQSSTSFANESALSRGAVKLCVTAGLPSAIIQGYIAWGLGFEGVVEKLKKGEVGSLLCTVAPGDVVWNVTCGSGIIAVYSILWDDDDPLSFKIVLTVVIPLILVFTIWRVWRNLPSII